jgi:hypothetical protein
MNWRHNPLNHLSRRRWGDEPAAVDAGAVNTNQLDPIAVVALMCAEEAPHDFAGMTVQAAVEFQLAQRRRAIALAEGHG